MIIEKQKELHVKTVGDISTYQMGVVEDVALIMDAMIEMYRNPYATIPGEYLSNAWDSHLEAGCTDKAIVCKIGEYNGQDFIAFQDFGVGMSPQRIKECFTFGYSTKKKDAKSIGAYGLGSKSAFAYTNSFYVDTVYNGIEYKYLIHKDEEGIPSVTSLVEVKTTKENQTIIWFYIGNDRYNFIAGLKQKTLYFDNLVYDVDEDLNCQIFRGEHFVYCPDTNFNNLHLLVGQVPYSIDWNTLGMFSIDVPIAIKVDVSEGVIPLRSREDIKYTDKAVEVIKEKIELARAELAALINEQRKNTVSPSEYFQIKRVKYNYRFDPTTNLNLEDLFLRTSYEIKLPKIDGLPNVDLKNIGSNPTLFYPLSQTHNIISGLSKLTYKPRFRDNLDLTNCLFKGESRFSNNKTKYIGETNSRAINIYQIEKLNLRETRYLLNLDCYPRSEWRNYIEEYNNFIMSWANKMKKYEDIEVPDTYKPKPKVIRTPDSIPYSYADFARGWNNYNIIFSSGHYLSLKIYKKNYIIYGCKDEKQALKEAFLLVGKKYRIIMIAKRNKALLKDKSGYIDIREFVKGTSRPFSRSITAYMIDKELPYLSDNELRLLNCLDSQFVSDFKKLRDYKCNYLPNNNNSLSNTFRDQLIEIAKRDKTYDHSIYYILQRAINKWEKLDFIKVFGDFSRDNLQLPVDISVTYIKNKFKYRLNLEHYVKKNDCSTE